MFHSREIRIWAGLLSVFGALAASIAMAEESGVDRAGASPEMEIVEVVERLDLWPRDQGEAFRAEAEKVREAIVEAQREQLTSSVSSGYEQLVAALEMHERGVRMASLLAEESEQEWSL